MGGERRFERLPKAASIKWVFMKPKHTFHSGRHRARRRQCLLQALAALLFLGLAMQPALAQNAQSGDAQAEEQVTGPVNQRQALERVRARFPGNVISINEVKQEDRVRYRIRIDNEGNIYTVYVDQATGVISRE